MKKLLKTLDRVEDIILVTLMALMVIVVFTTTFARYTALFKMSWGEEFTRYCMIWMIFLGVIIAAKTGGHFAVTAFDSIMPKPLLKVFLVLRMVCVVAFNFYASYYGYILVSKQIAMGQITPSLQIPMWIMYCAMPFGLIFMAVRYVFHTVDIWKGVGKDEEVQL